MKKFFKKTEGFTLVELIVVIAILGILAGVGTVGYSGYIKKANMAADEQLLASLNTAFASACIENGVDAHSLTSATATLKDAEGGNGKEVDAVSPYQTEFEKYFEGGAFKVIKALYFDKGVFSAMSSAYADVLQKLLDECGGDITKLNGSAFMQSGMAELLGKVDYAADLAGAIVADDEEGTGKLTQLLLDPSNVNSMSQYLGFGEYVEGESDEFETKLESMVSQRAALLAAQNGGAVTEEILTQARIDIMTNNAVLIAATKSTFNSADFKTKLGSGLAKDEIKSNLGTDGDTQKGLAQAALAYGMYTAYATHNNIDTSNVDLNTVLNALETEEFMAYINAEDGKAQKDMDGYMAAMNMINTSSTNSSAVENLLINGFADPELVGLLQQAAGAGATGD